MSFADWTGPVSERYIEIDGDRFFQFSAVVALAEELIAEHPTLRFWQSVHNILTQVGQAGIGGPWPELFYATDRTEGMTQFERRYELIDDFIMPRDPYANIPAYT